MDIGATLRSAREQRKLSLDQLSRITKISTGALSALERNEIHKLPGGIFVRGFLRAYAREVGLDAEEIVGEYRAQFEAHSTKAATAQADDVRSAPAASWRTIDLAEGWHRARTISLQLLPAILVVAFGIAALIVVPSSRTPAPPSDVAAEPPTSEALSSSRPAPSEIATSGQSTDAPAAQGHAVVRLDIRASGPCWFEATADGVSVAYRLMHDGEHETIEASNEVLLRIGDPATFNFLINDRPGRSLGAAGRAVTIRITPQNYRGFITS
jgi:cytoskeletal protein RodZ